VDGRGIQKAKKDGENGSCKMQNRQPLRFVNISKCPRRFTTEIPGRKGTPLQRLTWVHG